MINFSKAYYSINKRLYLLFIRSRKVERYLRFYSIRKLHIGCGGNALEGWLNVDISRENKDVVYMDAAKPFPIPDNTFDYVFSEHVFEHLNIHGQLNYLYEARRILKPGGVIRIATPNIERIIGLFKKGRNEVENDYLNWNYTTFLKDVNLILKDINHKEVYVVNNFFRDWGHQLIHSPESINHLIELTGYSDIQRKNVMDSNYAALMNLEKHGCQIGEKNNVFETMVYECKKPF